MSQPLKLAAALLVTFALFGLGLAGYVRLKVPRQGPMGVTLADVPFGAGPDAASIPEGRAVGFEKELEGLSEVHKTLFNRALEDATAGRRSQALQSLDELMRARPEFLPAFYHAAAIRRVRRDSLLGDAAEARSLYAKALALDARQPDLLHAYGEFLWEEGDRAGACIEFRKALEVSPHFVLPRAAIGRCLIEEKQFAEAARSFRLAISLFEGGSSAPYGDLALAYWHLDRRDSAQAVLDFAAARSLESPRLELVRGLLQEAEGDLGGAEGTYRRILARYPADTDAGEALRTLGRKGAAAAAAGEPCPEVPSAVALLEPLISKHPESAPLWLALGQAYLQAGQPEKAIASLDSSLSLDSTDADARESRDRAEAALLQARSSSGTGAETVAGASGVPASGVAAGTDGATGVPVRRDDGGILRDPAATAALAGVSTSSPTVRLPLPLSEEGDGKVVIPGATALLGSYNLYWGASRKSVPRAYPAKKFDPLANGNMKETFVDEGLKLEQVLAFRRDSLWGVHVTINDTAAVPGDVLGRALRLKTRISGEGRGTGPSKCDGYREFQGVIWENEDTFEFMAQFEGRENQVRLVRVGRQYLPQDQRLCSLVELLNPERWEK